MSSGNELEKCTQSPHTSRVTRQDLGKFKSKYIQEGNLFPRERYIHELSNLYT
jgi:hypothetical protein